MLKQLKAWYLKTFLPFENPSHPLYCDGSTEYENEFLQEISDWVEAEVAVQEEIRVGPNYSRQMGDKPTQYEKWGNKWYRKSR